MELEEALARIEVLEGEVRTLTGARDALADERDSLTSERDALLGERDASHGRMEELESAQAMLEARLAETLGVQEATAASLIATEARGLDHLRRALLAEHAGQLVPELLAGESEEALLASVEVARGAYARALEAARAAIFSQAVPAGATSARGAPIAGLTPLELIEAGLRN